MNLKSFLDNIKELSSGHLPVAQKGCDHIGCNEKGDYKAPKSRYDLRDYYWFCLEHVQEYNKQWDFFKGMTPGEIQHHMNKSALGDRPTWISTKAGMHDEKLKQKIYEHFSKGDSVFGNFNAEEDSKADEPKMNIHVPEHPSIEAMEILELSPPVTWDEIKTQYKKLAKQYHPDTNKEDGAEETFKKISMAYSILKLSHETYSQLDER